MLEHFCGIQYNHTTTTSFPPNYTTSLPSTAPVHINPRYCTLRTLNQALVRTLALLEWDLRCSDTEKRWAVLMWGADVELLGEDENYEILDVGEVEETMLYTSDLAKVGLLNDWEYCLNGLRRVASEEVLLNLLKEQVEDHPSMKEVMSHYERFHSQDQTYEHLLIEAKRGLNLRGVAHNRATLKSDTSHLVA